ncbi:maestro heat-like repeat family member 5 [Moschus berezovskii]|uniref:maestro heat-like repeat family member 5 n=1 Tax=Moschus berezovskii TaxID=68408 RepID=UPI0024437C82|nr:maestro heat-like repeat family member 5 [Moschus berezovskii]
MSAPHLSGACPRQTPAPHRQRPGLRGPGGGLRFLDLLQRSWDLWAVLGPSFGRQQEAHAGAAGGPLDGGVLDSGSVLPNPEERFLTLEQERGLRVAEDASSGPAFSNCLCVLAQLLQCPDVAAAADKEMVRTLADWFQREEPAIVKLLLRAVEILSRHENTGKQLRALQPYVLSCCYSADGSIVAETFQVLRDLVDHLPWQRSAAFLIQLAFTLTPFLEEESEHLRLTAFEVYGALLAKVNRRLFVFPLRHQALNLLIALVLHLEDANGRVAQIARPTLCHLATLLGWSKLRATFAEKDVWTILSALLQQEAGRALWFLKQSVLLFRSPQVPIRLAAVWFAGQIIQTLGAEEAREVDEVHAALRHMRADPDPTVSCLATQTSYILEAKEKMCVASSTSCFCPRRRRKAYF